MSPKLNFGVQLASQRYYLSRIGPSRKIIPMEARIRRQQGSALRQCEVPRGQCNLLKCLENLARTSTCFNEVKTGKK